MLSDMGLFSKIFGRFGPNGRLRDGAETSSEDIEIDSRAKAWGSDFSLISGIPPPGQEMANAPTADLRKRAARPPFAP